MFVTSSIASCTSTKDPHVCCNVSPRSVTETNDGRLLSFDGGVSVGPATTRFSGSVAEGELKVETRRGGSRTTETMPWNPTFRGLVALEQSLRQRPMQTKGEERTLKMLLPGRYELATASMRCVGLASVPLLDGELHELIEINCEMKTEDGATAFSTIWTNREGEIARTHSPGLQLIAYRTDRETATSFEGNDQVVAVAAGDRRNQRASRRPAGWIQNPANGRRDPSKGRGGLPAGT